MLNKPLRVPSRLIVENELGNWRCFVCLFWSTASRFNDAESFDCQSMMLVLQRARSVCSWVDTWTRRGYKISKRFCVFL